MIIVNIKGGLGNQMFQYALGRALALKNHDVLKIDPSGLDRLNANGDTFRAFKLGHFNIVADTATAEEVRALKYSHGVFSKLARKFGFKILRRFHKGWEPDALEKTGDVYMDGFWQSWKYFDGIADTIRVDFTLKNPLSDVAHKIQSAMRQVHSVSVHVRRGDYATNVTLVKSYGLLEEDYYRRAITAIREKVENPVFFVFSDDIAWVKSHASHIFSFQRSQERWNEKEGYRTGGEGGEDTKNGTGAKVFYVSDYNVPDYEEMVLMSSCKHHIIANSSFSWWGAWLNPSTEKIIIAPNVWFKKKSLVPTDLIPPDWIRV